MEALRALVYELFLEVFYGKNDKIIKNFNNFFYILHEGGVKTFLI